MVSEGRRLARAALLVTVLGAILLQPVPGAAQSLPEPPRVFLDTTYVPPAGSVIQVPGGGDFQAALNAATPGTTLVLQAGATYTGNFTLPANPGPGWIYIVSSALPSLPEGTRVTPTLASLMPKLVSPNNNSVLTAGGGAQFYRLAGIELTTLGGQGGVDQYNLVAFAAGNDIVVDRSYLHGSWNQYVRQGVQLNNARTAIIDSYLAEFHISDGDAQVIVGWNGPGPFKIVNNHLEGAAENILFGGADPSVPNLVPSDIEIRGNHIVKPLSWWPGSASYTGIHWTVKNLFELKNAQRVLIDGNILENCWVDHNAAFGQQGATGFVLTTRNQGGGCPWCVIQDVTITNNIARNLGQASVFGGSEGAGARRVLARNNLFSVNAQLWGPGAFVNGANGRLFHLGSISTVTIDHNTGFQDGAILWDDGSVDNATVAYTNNLSLIGGAAGTGSGFQGGGTPSTTLSNVFIGGSAGNFPSGNFFPASAVDVGFVNYAGGDYRLSVSSPYKNAGTDGEDIGANIDAINAATACAVSGACSGPPPPPITSMSLSPTSLAFGSVTVGTTSVPSNVRVTNTGTTGISVSSITVSGPFKLSSTDCSPTSTWNGIMAPGTHCNASVVSAPVASGSTTGTLKVIAAGTSKTVALSGTGTTLPAVSVSPTSATVASGGTRQFTATVTGTTSTAVSWTANLGTISSTGLYAAPTVSANTTATVTATSVATPTASATVSVAITSPPPPSTSFSLSPISVSFGSVNIGTTSAKSAKSNVRVKNTGTTGLSVSGITASGPFKLSSTDCYPTSTWNGIMAPGTHCNASVVFAPVTSGSATGTLTITAAGSSKTVALSGTGLSSTGAFSLSPTSVSFGSVNIGTTSAKSNVWVTNTGTTGLSVSSVTVSGPFKLSSTDCSPTSTWNGIMAPGTHCNVNVVFTPVTSGSVTGTLTVTAAGTSKTVALSGAGF